MSEKIKIIIKSVDEFALLKSLSKLIDPNIDATYDLAMNKLKNMSKTEKAVFLVRLILLLFQRNKISLKC